MSRSLSFHRGRHLILLSWEAIIMGRNKKILCKLGHKKEYLTPMGYLECRTCRVSACRRYDLQHSDKNSGKSGGYRYRFGGNRESVLTRDRYTCQSCGMNNDEHKLRWNRNITIDHIDGNGRYSKLRNNNMDNLVTLCLSCHGKKDSARRTY